MKALYTILFVGLVALSSCQKEAAPQTMQSTNNTSNNNNNTNNQTPVATGDSATNYSRIVYVAVSHNVYATLDSIQYANDDSDSIMLYPQNISSDFTDYDTDWKLLKIGTEAHFNQGNTVVVYSSVQPTANPSYPYLGYYCDIQVQSNWDTYVGPNPMGGGWTDSFSGSFGITF